MDETLTAVFDGEVLRPDLPPNLEPNRCYLISIRQTEAPADAPEMKGDAWDVLTERAGSLEAPDDWAREHDHYLYGTPKGVLTERRDDAEGTESAPA